MLSEESLLYCALLQHDNEYAYTFLYIIFKQYFSRLFHAFYTSEVSMPLEFSPVKH